MLSWDTDEGKGAGRSGSLRAPATSLDRLGSQRKSVDYVKSPASSLPKAGSILRGSAGGGVAVGSPGSRASADFHEPEHVDDQIVGRAGWWHAMEHGHLNERPEADTGKGTKQAGFTPQFSITGMGNRYASIFKEEDEQQQAVAAPAPAAPMPASAPVATPSASASVFASATAAAEGAAPAPSAVPSSSPAVTPAASASDTATASSTPSAPADATDAQAAGKGWWTKMESNVLNEPEKREAGVIQKGEKAFGGNFAPQFGVPGLTNNYRSLFQDKEPKAEVPAASALAQDVKTWVPFDAKAAPAACAPAAAQAAATKADEEWEPFKSAPPITRVA